MFQNWNKLIFWLSVAYTCAIPENSSGQKETCAKKGPFSLTVSVGLHGLNCISTLCFTWKTAFLFWQALVSSFDFFILFWESLLIKEVKWILYRQTELLPSKQNPFSLWLIFVSMELKVIGKISAFAVWNYLILFLKLLSKTKIQLDSRHCCLTVRVLITLVHS